MFHDKLRAQTSLHTTGLFIINIQIYMYTQLVNVSEHVIDQEDVGVGGDEARKIIDVTIEPPEILFRESFRVDHVVLAREHPQIRRAHSLQASPAKGTRFRSPVPAIQREGRISNFNYLIIFLYKHTDLVLQVFE